MKKLLFILIPLFFIACSEDDKNTSLTDEQIKQKIDEALYFELANGSEIVEYFINANITLDSLMNTDGYIFWIKELEDDKKSLEEAKQAFENGEECCPHKYGTFDSWEEYIREVEGWVASTQEKIQGINNIYTKNNHVVLTYDYDNYHYNNIYIDSSFKFLFKMNSFYK